MSGYIYLASPYSHPDAKVRQERFELACKAAGILMERGYVIFSPIAHSHAIEQTFDEIRPGPFWMAQDIPILQHASELFVLTLDGWQESVGVKQEIDLARHLRLPVNYISMPQPVRSGNDLTYAA